MASDSTGNGSLIYSVGFDLDGAIDKTANAWDSKYADRLEKALQKRALNIKLAVNTKSLDSLEDVKKRLAELKIEPLTPENKKAIQELTRELKTLLKAFEKLGSLRGIELPELQMARAAKLAKEVEQADEKLRIAQDRVRQSEERLLLSQQRAAAQAHKTGKAYHRQTTYLERLIKRMAVYVSIGAVGSFLTKVREVTAEFDLQRVSLGAIIQDQTRANQLFAEIKSFALTSPVSILDLTKYTKQLAAYKLGVDELFDTTKRLTDISVGLGVSMDRVVLAYGQIRATGYLRSSEIRQLTEMGVPIVEELSKKLTEMNGRLVSSADVLKMVEERAISFGMVKDIFDQMTSAGGAFYQMQEKQGNTLFGLWAKLGDAASMMYDEIGNTEAVNNAMKATIENLTTLIKNWKAVAAAASVVGGAGAIGFLGVSASKKGAEIQASATSQAELATRKRVIAEKLLTAAKRDGSIADTVAAVRALETAKADEQAALAAQKRALASNKLALGLKAIGKTLLTGLGIGAVITLVTTLVYKFVAWREEATRLKIKLDEISTEQVTLTAQAARNLEYLAEKAVNAGDGTREQIDALEELKRTYGSMVPAEELELANLRKLNGEYSSLTNTIQEYISMQQRQKAISAANEEFGAKIVKSTKALRSFFKGALSPMGLSDTEIERFFVSFSKEATDVTKSLRDKVVDAFKNIGLDVSKAGNASFLFTNYAIKDLNEAYMGLEEQLNAIDKAYSESTATLGEYTKEWDAAKEAIKNVTVNLPKGTYLYDKELKNQTIREYANFLKDVLGKSYASLEESIGAEGDKMSRIFFDQIMADFDKFTIDQKNAIILVKRNYDALIPPDSMVNLYRDKLEEFAKITNANMNVGRNYFINLGESSEEYVERLQKDLKSATSTLKDYQFTNEQLATGKTVWEPIPEETVKEAQAEVDLLTKMIDFLSQFLKTKGGGKTDPRLGLLQEMASLAQTLNKEFSDLEKKAGTVFALNEVSQTYAETIAHAQEELQKYGLVLPELKVPKDTAMLTDYLKQVQVAIQKLPQNVQTAKAAIELGVVINKAETDVAQKQIEAELTALSEKIANTKAAREFYDKILSQSGDVEFATNVTMSVYGDTGDGLYEQMKENIQNVFQRKDDVPIDFSLVFDDELKTIDYSALADIYNEYYDSLIEGNRAAAKSIISEGRKTLESNISNWQKELAKAKDFEQKRNDIIRQGAEERKKIIKSALPEEVKSEYLALSFEKQAQSLSDLNFEEFKASEDYIKIFQDLGDVSSKTLNRLEKELRDVIATSKDLSPENMKTLINALDSIAKERQVRDPFKDLFKSLKAYRTAHKEHAEAQVAEAKAQKTYSELKAKYDEELESAMQRQSTAQEAVNKHIAAGTLYTTEGAQAQLELEDAKAATLQVENKIKSAANDVTKATRKTTNAQDKQKKAVQDVSDDLGAMANSLNNAASFITDIAEKVGVVEDSEMGDLVNGFAEGLQAAASTLMVIQAILVIIESSMGWLALIGAAVGALTAIGTWLSNGKVRAANKEIERQQELLDKLEYTYERLEKASEKAFGSEYISNYNQQLRNLQQQQSAYMKQAEAERSKGKKADKDKIKDYEESAREAADSIVDLYGAVSEKMLGSDLTSAARDFASAWLDAYKEFSSTTDAIKEKFNDMIENMIVESLLAKVMERALQPVFDMIDTMGETDFSSTAFWQQVVEKASKATQEIDSGANLLMNFLEQAGLSVRDLGSDMSGISRDIATASEESINGLAAGINTQNYYISQIHANVVQIVQMLYGGTEIQKDSAYTDLIAMQNQYLSSLPTIAANTASTAERCERAALACEEIANNMKRVISARGTQSSHVVNTFM